VNIHADEPAWESTASLRHEFAIGPLREHPLFKSKARQYYCIRCEWTYLVSGATVVVLDGNGSPLAGDEGTKRFNTFALGPCPVLEALTSEAYDDTTKSLVNEIDDSKESGYWGRVHVSGRNFGVGPLRRILSRLRGDLRRLAGSI
jgi:hypothetical protein